MVGVVCCWFSVSTIATLPTIEELKIPTTTGVAYLPDAKETKLTYLFKFGHTPRLESRFVEGHEAEREEGGPSGSQRRLGPRHVQRLPSPKAGEPPSVIGRTVETVEQLLNYSGDASLVVGTPGYWGA